MVLSRAPELCQVGWTSKDGFSLKGDAKASLGAGKQQVAATPQPSSVVILLDKLAWASLVGVAFAAGYKVYVSGGGPGSIHDATLDTCL